MCVLHIRLYPYVHCIMCIVSIKVLLKFKSTSLRFEKEGKLILQFILVSEIVQAVHIAPLPLNNK